MAIDQEIQSKVDAYRSNPQALQQRYAQNQQLVDLLALQKIKSEMDAAKRDVQMQMQQQPGTIKQQREQELMQRTKQDMMDQTAGVMRQKQAQQQKNIQQVAQKGLGALAPQRPPAPAPAQQIANQSQPVPKMAAGGIVAFQEGGLSSMGGLDGRLSLDEQIAIIRRRTDLNEGQKQSLIDQVRAQQPQQREDRQYTTPVGRASSARMPGSPPNIPVGSETSALDVMAATNPRVAPPRAALPTSATVPSPTITAPQATLEGPEATAVQTAPAPAGIESLIPTAGPDDGLRGGPAPDTASPAPAATPAPTGAAANIPTESGGLAGLGVGVGGGSAEAAMERGFARADQYTGRAEKAGRYAEMEARLAELDEAMYDPADERRDQLKAFLIGTGGRGSTALAGGAAASMNLRSEQKADRRARLMDQFAIAERGMAVDTDLAQTGLSLGREMYAQVSANNRAALSAAASLRNTELRNQMEAAKLQYTERRDNEDRDLRAQEAAVQAADAAARQSTADLGATSSALDRLLRVQDEELQRQFDAQGIDDLNVQLSFAADDEAAAALEQEIARRAAVARVDAQTILNESGVIDAQERLTMRLIDLTGIETGDLPELTMDDLDSVTYTE